MNCKFSFYEGKKGLLENVNKSELSIDTVDFPFYAELGFFSEITDIKAVTDFDPDEKDQSGSPRSCRKKILVSADRLVQTDSSCGKIDFGGGS